MKKKAIVNIVVSIAMAVVLVVGGAFAYLTATDSADNTFTLGSVSIDLLEPNFVETNATNLVPGATIAKDPQIKNTGANAAKVFLSVSIPKANIAVIDGSGVKGAVANQALFTFTASSDWTLVETKDNATTTEYIYGYNSTLAPAATTSALFSSVSLVNYVETPAATEQHILVNAYAIQADLAGATTPADVWNVYKTAA